jgi:hypothetical protein
MGDSPGDMVVGPPLAVATDGAVPAEDRAAALSQEASHFMDNVASVRVGTATGTITRRGESFFDTVSRRQSALDKNISFVRLTKILKITIEWRDLTYVVTVGRRKKRAPKTVLENLSGQVPPGRLLAGAF